MIKQKIEKWKLAGIICHTYCILGIFYLGYITFVLKSYNKYPLLGLSFTIVYILGNICHWKYRKKKKYSYVDDVMYDPDKKKFIRNKIILYVAIALTVVLVGVFYPIIFM